MSADDKVKFDLISILNQVDIDNLVARIVAIERDATKNIFSTNNLSDGRLNSLGTITSDSTYSTSDFIFIETNVTYCTNQTIFTVQYDSDRNFIKYLFVTKNTTFTTEFNAMFIRISVDKTLIDSLQVTKKL